MTPFHWWGEATSPSPMTTAKARQNKPQPPSHPCPRLAITPRLHGGSGRRPRAPSRDAIATRLNYSTWKEPRTWSQPFRVSSAWSGVN
jgi:hypothetical protein